MLGIVVPYWNPFGNDDRLANLQRSLEQLRVVDNVKVLCVEMDAGYPSGLADIVVQAPADARYLWQKERLVNLGCEILAAEGINNFGYVDGDCLFVERDWVTRVDAAFQAGHNIVQGFSRAVNGVNSVPAALTSFPQLGSRLHGGAIFLQKEVFEHVGGLYEFCIVGGGDFVLMMAITGDHESLEWIFPNEIYRRHVIQWLNQFRDLAIRPACADNSVEILNHGSPQRSHRLRHILLQDFDPEQDIARGDTLGFTERGERLLPRLRAYCAHREDRPDMIVRGDTTGGNR